MTEQPPIPERTPTKRIAVLAGACLLLFLVGGVVAVLRFRPAEIPKTYSDTEVPLGVEQAVIIRSGGPRLQARPYRRGASVNLRIANEVQQGDTRIYDIRYVINLPGEFDLTDYLTSTDGRSLDNLPSFRVAGLTSLTKDIETRIQEIETVGIRIWHWYYETLVGLGVVWLVWLMGLIFIGRPPRPKKETPRPPKPSITEQIDRYLRMLADGELSVDDKARLESLLLQDWRERLGMRERRMATACRYIEENSNFGQVYRQLQAWLHNPRAAVGANDFVLTYRDHVEQRGAEP
ncbi:MAG: hypothetical protein KJ000_28870 [Pirellulaceae bacterium]|nr:hypothetical protein [Pirellulaceae bacterium]